ncbi:unnamed protein product [Allacma fusca]|uniref:Uncharacterized protein n=1 Tax=Allacma fusca TaxID=39272 RepID=A0A8J2NRZ4_9HEXA|nr:unnamed protein product [Allacma fusca]
MATSNTFELEEELLKNSIGKIRNTAKFFRKSPKKHSLLQKQMQKDKLEIRQISGKDICGPLNLLLDVQTRWSSLMPMLERYMLSQRRIEKTLIDLKSQFTPIQRRTIVPLNEDESEAITTFLKVLGPLRTATEEISASDVNLLNFEEIYSVLMQEIAKDTTEFGRRLGANIVARINHRRTEWSKILYALHHGLPNSDTDEESDSDSEFYQTDMSIDPKIMKSRLLLLLTRLFEGVKDYPNPDDEITVRTRKRRKSDCGVEDPSELSLCDRMRYRKKLGENRQETHHAPPERSLSSSLHELKDFRESGPLAKRGCLLQLAYDYLLTIRPVYRVNGIFQLQQFSLRSNVQDLPILY